MKLISSMFKQFLGPDRNTFFVRTLDRAMFDFLNTLNEKNWIINV